MASIWVEDLDAAETLPMHEAAAATETYPTPNVQNASGVKGGKMLLKVMVEPLCLRPGASVDPSHLHAEASPFVLVCGALIPFLKINLTYLFIYFCSWYSGSWFPSRDWLCSPPAPYN